MVTEDNISVPIVTDPKPAEEGLRKFERDAKDSGDRAQKNLSRAGKDGAEKFSDYFKKAGLAIVGYLSVRAVSGFIESSAKAAMEADKAILGLNNALAINGDYSSAASEKFQKLVSSLEQTTGVGDEVINMGARMLVTLGKLSGEGLERATKASLDMAAALNMDAGTAFNLVAKAASGNTDALSRYGIKIDENIPKAEKFAALMEKLSKWKGLAAAQADTFSGVLARLSTNFGNLQEEVGKLFTRSGGLKEFFKFLADSLGRAADAVTEFGKSGDIIGHMIIKFIDLGTAVIRFVVAPLEVLSKMARAVFFTIVSGIDKMLQGLSYVGVGVGKLIAVFDKDLGGSIGETSQMLADTFGETSAEAAATVQANLATAFDLENTGAALKFTESMRAAVAGGIGVLDETKPTIQAAITESVTPQPGFFDGFVSGFAAAAGELEKNAKALGAAVKATLAGGFSQAFSSIGKNLVEGKSMFGDFGKMILSTLGAVAMQMGAFFIATGIGYMFLPGAQGNAAGLIGAGIGLSILGGALQALGGSGGSGAGAAGSGAAIGASGGGIQVDPTATQNTLDEDIQSKPSTNVVVNVQGNILDRRESGLEIAQIINEAFDSQGVIIARSGAFA